MKETAENIAFQEEINKITFISLMEQEGFRQTIDVAGSFQGNMPVFYKKVSDDYFLIFNIPYYRKVEDATFQTDFWLVKAEKEAEFLNKRVDDDKLKLIKLGFQIQTDFKLYSRMIEELNTAHIEYQYAI